MSPGGTAVAEPRGVELPSARDVATPVVDRARQPPELVTGHDPERAWDAFLERFAPLVLQVVRLFERDADAIDDCFLFACERLRRDDLRRLRAFRDDGSASFPTWLRAVVRNLCLDWRRARFGRPRLPRAIARLPRLDQETFRALFLRGLSENEALHTLRPLFPSLAKEGLDESVARIRRSLDGRQTWSLLVRRPRRVPLAEPNGDDDRRSGVDLPDPRRDPAAEVELREALAALQDALGRRTPRERLLIRLRYEQGLSVEQIARLHGFGSAAAVEARLERAVAALRADLETPRPDGVSVQ